MGYGAFYVICPRASSQYVTPLIGGGPLPISGSLTEGQGLSSEACMIFPTPPVPTYLSQLHPKPVFTHPACLQFIYIVQVVIVNNFIRNLCYSHVY